MWYLQIPCQTYAIIEEMWTSKGTPARALLYTILLSATIHLVITLFTALFTGAPDKANMFVVLGFNLIWPELGEGSTSALLGGITVALIWVVVFTVMRLHKRKTMPKPKKTTHETTV
jgi:hypothetical protein